MARSMWRTPLATCRRKGFFGSHAVFSVRTAFRRSAMKKPALLCPAVRPRVLRTLNAQSR